MRLNATGAEARLWQYLRRHPMMGSHFRRQVVIGPYIADFACMAARLVIEVDGSQHGDSRMQYDETRTKWLESEGYRVLRVWNNEVMQNSAGAVEAVYAALYGAGDSELVPFHHTRRKKSDHPTPARSARRPSPSRGG
jgi:very-short-patch-repair endonuclease